MNGVISVEYCVISAVDKSKAVLAFTCPLLYQHKMLKMHSGMKNINTYYDKEQVMNSVLESDGSVVLFRPVDASTYT